MGVRTYTSAYDVGLVFLVQIFDYSVQVQVWHYVVDAVEFGYPTQERTGKLVVSAKEYGTGELASYSSKAMEKRPIDSDACE